MTLYETSMSTVPIPVDSATEKLIALHSSHVVYPAKKIFLDIGDPMDAIYFIHRGRTKHYILTDGGQKTIYTLCSGWFFGESPMLMGDETTLISETMEESEIWKIGRMSYESLLDRDRNFRSLVLTSMSRKIMILRHEVEGLVFTSVKDRILRFLCASADTSRLVDGSWYDLKNRYTQQEIATFVGSSRVTCSKLINEMCADGDLRQINHRIQVSLATYRRIMAQNVS